MEPKNSVVGTIAVDMEIIEIESDTDTDEVGGGRMLALCGPVSCEVANTVVEYGETSKTSMQIVCVDVDSGPGSLVFDSDYQKYLASCSENGILYLLEDNVRESSPLRLMYNVDNKKSGAGRKGVSSVSKRLRTENGRAKYKQISKKGRKIGPTKNTVELKPAEDVKDVQRGRKSSAIKKNFKAYKKVNEKNSAKRNAKSQTIFRASKRLKTENGRADYYSINTKDTRQKKRESPQGRKIPVTKNNVDSKSKSHVKDEKFHRSEAWMKENEKSLSSIDKVYACYLKFLRNSLTIFESDQKLKPVKDLVCLSDPDIIAMSNHPFPDGGNFPFEANKDEKVIDVEDGVESDDIFNSMFSKKLMEILRRPYDKKEFLKLSKMASLKRPLTRSRELRDGREITYNVKNEWTLSFLEQYPDFKKKFHQCEKDCSRALNLLRGFFFYLKNIVLEGAFKPWTHEKRLMDLCFDASKRKATVP